MNNLKNYDEFINEGLYDYFNRTEKNITEFTAWTVLIGFLLSIVLTIYEVISKMTDKNAGITWVLFICIVVFLNNLIIRIFLRDIMKIIYNYARSKTLIGRINTLIKSAEDEIEKYPELEEKIIRVKSDLRKCLESKDKKQISKGIHDIYEISKVIKMKKKYANIFNKTAKEIEYETGIAKVDPLGEENWDD